MAEGRRLLAVDDDEHILSIVSDVARGLGFEVSTLSESARFMTAYVRSRPHVITLDMMMPDMDGIEIIRWLSDIGSTARVVIISGHSTFLSLGGRLAEARGALSTTLVRKPFAIADLRATLMAAQA